MINILKLLTMARKWQKMAIRGRRRISLSNTSTSSYNNKKEIILVDEGCFVAYAAGGERFAIPLEYLQRPVIGELLRMAEDEFGLHIDGAITFPCDAAFMEYALSILKAEMPREVENALVVFLTDSNSSSCRGIMLPELQQDFPSCRKTLHGF